MAPTVTALLLTYGATITGPELLLTTPIVRYHPAVLNVSFRKLVDSFAYDQLKFNSVKLALHTSSTEDQGHILSNWELLMTPMP